MAEPKVATGGVAGFMLRTAKAHEERGNVHQAIYDYFNIIDREPEAPWWSDSDISNQPSQPKVTPKIYRNANGAESPRGSLHQGSRHTPAERGRGA